MPKQRQRFEPPRNESDFEDWCCDIYRRKCDASSMRRHGRRGERQGGVDLRGVNRQGEIIGVQCKLRHKTKLTIDEIDEDVGLAVTQHSDLSKLIIATTSDNAAAIQKHVTRLDSDHAKSGHFRIEIDFWEDIERYLEEDGPLRSKLIGGMSATDVADFKTMMDEVLKRTGAIETLGHKSKEEIDRAIDAAFELAEGGEFDVCIGRLEMMLEGSALSKKSKFRIAANIGNAHALAGRFDKAAHWYREARAFSNSATARLLEARAAHFEGDDPTTRKMLRKLLDKSPNHPSGTALWVQVSELRYPEISVAEELLDNAEVALALSWRASDEGDLGAAEQHARDAVAAEPEWVIALINLAGLILTQERNSAAIAKRKLLVQDRDRVQEAIRHLDRALLAQKGANDFTRGTALYNRAGARRLIGDNAGSDQDLREASRLLPNEPQVLATLGIAHQFEGRSEDAVAAFRRMCELDSENTMARHLLASALADSDSEDDWIEARKIFESLVENVDLMPRLNRFEFAMQLADLRHRQQRAAFNSTRLPCDDLCVKLEDGGWVLRAWWELRVGDSESARTTCDNGDRGSLTEPEYMLLARIYLRLQDPRAAMDVVRPHARDNELSDLTELFMMSAIEAREYDQFRRWSKSLRQAGIWSSEIIQTEVQLLVKYHESGEALELLRAALERDDSDVGLWLTYGNLLVGDETDQDSLRRVRDHLPKPSQIEALQLDPAFRFVYRAGLWGPDEVLGLAYQLWRQHRSNHRAWSALVHAHLRPDDQTTTAPWTEPTRVGPDTAVVLEPVGAGDCEIVCIVGDGVAEAEWDEFAVESATAQSLNGKQVGDEVALSGPLLTRRMKIRSIQKIEVMQASRCLERFTKYFPDVPFVQRIEIAAGPEVRKVDIETSLQPVVDAVRARRGAAEHVLRVYKENIVPAAMVGEKLGIDQVRIVEALLDDPSLFLRSGEDQMQREEWAGATDIALDLSAIVILRGLGLLQQVVNGWNVAVSRAAISSIDWTLAEGGFGGERVGSLIEVEGHPVVLESDEDARRKWLDGWKETKRVLEAGAQCVGGLALMSVEPEVRSQLESFLSDADAQLVAHCVETGTIMLSDDVAVAKVSRQLYSPIARIRCAQVVDELYARGTITASARDQARAKMHGWRVVALEIRPPDLVAALEMAQWRVSRLPAAIMFPVFGYQQPDRGAVVKLLLEFTGLVWRRIPPGVERTGILHDVLEIIRRRDDWQTIGRMALAAVDGVFGLDVLGADEVSSAIAIWLESPGTLFRV